MLIGTLLLFQNVSCSLEVGNIKDGGRQVVHLPRFEEHTLLHIHPLLTLVSCSEFPPGTKAEPSPDPLKPLLAVQCILNVVIAFLMV